MATSGTNNTVKWTLSNGVLTISPTSGNSGIARKDWGLTTKLVDWITLTADEVSSVQSIIFVGDIQFYSKDLGESSYSKSTGLTSFLFNFANASEIDVSGLNTTGVESFRLFFPKSLTILTGLSLMDVASGKDFVYMFSGAKLESLDLSTFPLNSADNISGMLDDLLYCQTVKLPSNFSRKFAALSEYSGEPIYSFGLAKVPITKNGVTVTSDEDFFKLDSTQGGTWTRDISGSASLSFQVKSTSREANIAIVNYQYATSSATVSIYLKKASESSFPSTSSKTVTISGTGNGSVNIELATDDAYDIKMVASDGNTSIYAYPSVGSNVLLFEIDRQGNINVFGGLRTKGNLYVEGDADVFGDLRTSGDIYTEGNIDISGGITAGGDVHADENTGYFKDVYLKNQTVHIGQIFNWQGNLKSNLTANAGAYVEAAGSITLPGGHTYLVIGYLAMTNSTNGTTNRRIQFFNKTNATALNAESRFVATQDWGTLQILQIFETSVDTALTVRGSASRPTTTIPTAWIRAVCIA